MISLKKRRIAKNIDVYVDISNETTVATPFGLHYHIVFKTEKDKNLPAGEQRKKFFSYIIGCVHPLGGSVKTIGGTNEQIQILVNLHSTEALSDFICKIKLLSAAWVRRRVDIPNFAWQDENGVYTVSVSECENLRRRMIRQERNHRRLERQKKLNELKLENAVNYKQLYNRQNTFVPVFGFVK